MNNLTPCVLTPCPRFLGEVALLEAMGLLEFVPKCANFREDATMYGIYLFSKSRAVVEGYSVSVTDKGVISEDSAIKLLRDHVL